jgi:Fe-S-cluster containining protein
VQLTTKEWLELTRRYGYAIVEQDFGRFYLRKTIDEKCPFLLRRDARFLCTLQQQNKKPLACKMWPFKVLDEPKYGCAKEAAFNFLNRRFYVYTVSNCPGIQWGRPVKGFIKKTLPEIIGLRLGQVQKQHFSTSS